MLKYDKYIQRGWADAEHSRPDGIMRLTLTVRCTEQSCRRKKQEQRGRRIRGRGNALPFGARHVNVVNEVIDERNVISK